MPSQLGRLEPATTQPATWIQCSGTLRFCWGGGFSAEARLPKAVPDDDHQMFNYYHSQVKVFTDKGSIVLYRVCDNYRVHTAMTRQRRKFARLDLQGIEDVFVLETFQRDKWISRDMHDEIIDDIVHTVQQEIVKNVKHSSLYAVIPDDVTISSPFVCQGCQARPFAFDKNISAYVMSLTAELRPYTLPSRT